MKFSLSTVILLLISFILFIVLWRGSDFKEYSKENDSYSFNSDISIKERFNNFIQNVLSSFKLTGGNNER
ncbi:MAG: hypothetical protein FWH53_00525 [Leptospirales bacterium]|nr:hypothetical protein [Leptospirales bacterium]